MSRIRLTVLILTLVAALVAPATAAEPLRNELRMPAAKELPEILSAVCTGTKSAVGAPACQTCPSYVEVPGKERFRIAGLLTGSFTKPGAQEAVVRMEGCEGHVNNFGGMVLLQREAKGWRFVRYDAGNNPGACQSIPLPDGRLGLVCVLDYMQSGEEAHILSLTDWSRREQKDPLLVLRNTIVASCSMSGKSYIVGDYDQITVSSKGLDVKFHAGQYRFPATLKRDACDEFKGAAGRPYQLSYAWTAGELVLSPESAAVRKRLQSVLE